MKKTNPLKYRNKKLEERFKNHLCRHCKHRNYWDGYYCNKRTFKWYDYWLKEIIRSIKYNISDMYMDVGWNFFWKHIFDRAFEFIPNKPVRRCRHYEYLYREHFGTRLMESDGTVWYSLNGK